MPWCCDVSCAFTYQCDYDVGAGLFNLGLLVALAGQPLIGGVISALGVNVIMY